jgi:proteasome assembly chaperone 2
MFNLKKSGKYSGFTLVIPSVSVGNVPQLTVDLIIQNLKMEKVGTVFHRCLVPIIGSSPFDHVQDNSSAAELFVCEQKNLILLQIRTPLTASTSSDFFQDFLNFTKRESIHRIVLLTSCFSYEQKSHIGSNLCEYMQNDKFKSENQFDLSTDWMLREDDNIFGKGFSLKLFKTLNEVSCVNFIIYVNEGDNSTDAEIFLKRINKFLQLFPTDQKSGRLSITFPQSWKYLFGQENTVDVY